MTVTLPRVCDLPRLVGRRPAVFVDHDVTLTPIVDPLLADYPDKLKVTPGKMAFEIQPKVGRDQGKAVHYLRHARHVDPEPAARITAVDFLLEPIEEVQRFLTTLAR